MDDYVSVAGEERFFASRKSQLGKARTNLWLGFAVVVAVAALVSGGSLQALALTVAVSLLILLPTDFALRKRMRAGQPLATLGDEAFESPNLTGKAKRCLWRDIERVTVASVQGTPYLQFHLRAPLGTPDRQSFWTGRNAARPTLLLSPFSAEDQERLLDGVERRLRRAAPDGAEPAVFGNELRQRQELQDRLKAMAPHTWATYALIAANLAVWLAMLSQGGGFLDAPADKLLLWGGNAASEVQRGEWWRLLTATFLHGGFVHVAMNMLGLLGAGILVERIYGKRLFLLVYFGSGLLGSALSLHFSAQEVVSVGASGAVFGVTGALLVAVWQHRDKLPKTFSKEMLSGIGFFVVYSLMQGFGKAGIDNAAHVGGLLGGCLIAYVLPERFDMDHFRRHYLSRALLALAAAGLATFGLAATAPRAAVDQARVYASQPLLEQGFKRFDAAIQAIQNDQADLKAGKLSERDIDARGRTVLAPEFHKVVEELSQVTLRPGDPRAPLLRDARRMSELIAESFDMASVEVAGEARPADPDRLARIEAELAEVSERLKADLADLKRGR